ncbi:Wzz/FepE/Etk N-terminal domain-containing protein [Paenibacillus thermotolerans]|uniref:Wzz/FepE/Etk N-terminal domain-containing protein n=1 Tax=Paenibacillus thermotolerans TaxID=3027807 RepID=UPI0023678E4F|nr:MULTISPECIES: Wzz/FepE/Etk N-terminal domain-containing protein [unclassified Paenibacillus]
MDQSAKYELSIRDIFQIIWRGKIIVSLIVILCILVSFFINFFMLNSVYEATSLVRFSIIKTEETPVDINSFAQTIRSGVTASKIARTLELEGTYASYEQIRSSISVSVIPDANVLKLSVKNTDPLLAAKISNMLAFDIASRIEITDRSDIIVTARDRLAEIEEELQLSTNELETAKELQKDTPEKIVNKKTLADEPYLLSIVNERNPNAVENGAITLVSEEMNPVFMELSQQIKQGTIQISKLTAEKEVLNHRINNNQTLIENLEKQNYSEKIASTNSVRVLTGLKALFITPALEPTIPVGPNKIVNIVLSAIIGLLTSLLIVFARYFWSASDIGGNRSNYLQG